MRQWKGVWLRYLLAGCVAVSIQLMTQWNMKFLFMGVPVIITLKKNISLLLLIHWFVLDPIFPCVMPADHGISVGLTPVVMVTSTVGCVIPTHSNSVVNKDIMLCAGSLVNRDDFLTQLGR
jgi:hypothetical protein